MAPSQDTDPHALHNRLRLAHQARRAKEHQLDDIRRALCDIGAIEDDDPYSHADLADVIRQIGPLPTPPAAQPDTTPERSYPITSPEWRPGEGYDRCPFRLKTGGGTLQCIFRAGHPPHGHTTTNSNPGTPRPSEDYREQRERPTHPDGTPYSYYEITAEGWGFCDGCRMWSTAGPQRPHECPETHISGPVAGGA
jgi:hypothetical protein